jgi:hypothetical protein
MVVKPVSLTYRFRYARRNRQSGSDRLENQPTDRRRYVSYLCLDALGYAKIREGETYPDPVALQKDFLKCTAMRLDTIQLPGVHLYLRDSCILK